MPYLINPSGRMVAVDDPKAYDEWLRTPGFTKPTAEQEQEYIKLRVQTVKKMQSDSKASEGLYFSTVSQGGKDGYSVSSGAIINELTKLGVNVKTHYSGQKVAILMHNPYSILRIEAPIRMLYTMFESTKIPDDWKEYLEAADMVLVPSQFCAKTFAKAGIKAEVVPLGYDDTQYQYIERMAPEVTRRDFTFLHYNGFNIRKGFSEVWQAFNEEFRKDEPVKLIIKTINDFTPLPITKSEYPQVEIVYGKIPSADLKAVMARSDCLVYPARGEGFGINPLECMATGMPVIVPNAHGISEYFNPEFMYEVKVGEECPGLYSRYKNQDVGKMVICDVADLRKQMRYVYDHWKEANEKGKAASEYVKKWTFANTAKQLKTIIDTMEDKPVGERSLRNALTLEPV
jgi:glycosyltransferase involved in cell wall biosynthesis